MDRRNSSSLYLLEMVPREVSCSHCVVREDKPLSVVCIASLGLSVEGRIRTLSMMIL